MVLDIQSSRNGLSGTPCHPVDVTGRMGQMSHAWYPAPSRLESGHGRGTISCSPPAGGTAVPENPIHTSFKPLTGGGLYSVPELVDCGGLNGEGGLQNLVRRILVETQACVQGQCGDDTLGVAGDFEFSNPLAMLDDSTSEEVKLAAKELSTERVLVSMLRDRLARRASDLKRTFIRRFSRSVFPNYDPARAAGQEHVKTLNFVLGGGTFSASGSDSFEEWEASRIEAKFLFGGWRRQSSSEIQDEMRKRALSEAASASLSLSDEDVVLSMRELEVGKDQWEARDLPDTFCNEQGRVHGDKLFKNSHALRAMVYLMGRPLQDGKFTGPSSILTIARADAWIATHFSFSHPNRDLSMEADAGCAASGLRNSRHNELFSLLLPRAVCSIMKEFRSEFEQIGDLVELSKPYSREIFQKILDSTKAAREDSGHASTGKDELSEAEKQTILSRLDEISPVPFSKHHMDLYSHSFRTHTCVHRSGSDKKDYLLLVPEFVTNKICPWIGKVCDAFIGQCKHDEQEFGEMTLSTSAIMAEDMMSSDTLMA